MVSDGQVRWPDAVSHMMGKLAGVKAGGLSRWFDTNTYFRRPVAAGTISAGGLLLVGEFRFARAIAPRPVTVTMTGPFTLSRLTLPGGPYADADGIMDALVPVLAEETGRLADAGATDIVVEEHYLMREPAGLARLQDALEVMAARRGPARLWLRLSFGDSAALYPALQKLPVDGLVLDFTCGPALAEAVARSGSDLPLGLGLVDARNIRQENPGELARLAGKLLKRIPGTAWLTASNGVEYLPRNQARQKMAILARVRDLLNGKRAAKSPARKSRPVRKGRKKPLKMNRSSRNKPPRRKRALRSRSARPFPRTARPARPTGRGLSKARRPPLGGGSRMGKSVLRRTRPARGSKPVRKAVRRQVRRTRKKGRR
jgi:5-methyltetrahydropteroyltriglutamate--homocysteine methyltransferase